MIEKVSEELGDVLIVFMRPKEKSGSYAFLRYKDEKSWLTSDYILRLIKT